MKYSRQNLPQDHYVYAYIRGVNSKNGLAGTPYYIGKGVNKRAWQTHDNVGRPKDLSQIVIIESNLTEIGALAIERRLIAWYGRLDCGTGILHNKTDGGDGSVNLSIESKEKIRQANIGRKITDETRKRMSVANKKHPPLSAEARKKISEKIKSRPISDETRAKISASLTGKKLSELHRKKLSEAKQGEKHNYYGKKRPPEVGQKIAEKLKGIKRSEETRALLKYYSQNKTEEVRKKLADANKRNQDKIQSPEARQKRAESMRKVHFEKKGRGPLTYEEILERNRIRRKKENLTQEQRSKILDSRRKYREKKKNKKIIELNPNLFNIEE